MPKRLLITAGPTHEPIDAVRYLANRSSGKLGLALAQAAHDAGWHVTLLLGPISATPPDGVTTHRFTTTADLESLLRIHFPNCDTLIMAAAVADYRPQQGVGAFNSPPSQGGDKGEGLNLKPVTSRTTKLPRTNQPLTLTLEPTPDLVAACCAAKRPDQFVLGFALEESAYLDRRATEKLARKKLDAIIANPLETMAADTINAKLITPTGTTSPGPMTKPAFARWLIAQLGK